MAAWNEPVFELIDVEQNTHEWLEARKGAVVSIGSSAMGAAAGISEFKSRYDLLDELVLGSVFRGNSATRHGHKYEGACAEMWSLLNNKVPTFEVGVCRPTRHNRLFSRDAFHLFGASIDRWACASCDLGGERAPDIRRHVRHMGFRVIECKCPYSERSFNRYYNRKIKHDHLAQLHLQMAVLGIRKIDYMVALINGETGQLEKAQLSRVRFSSAFWKWMYPRALDVALTALLCFHEERDPHESLLKAFEPEIPPSAQIKLINDL